MAEQRQPLRTEEPKARPPSAPAAAGGGGRAFRETELGPLPAEWEVVRLGNIAHVKYGKAKPKSSGSVPVVGSGGIYGWTDKNLVDFPTLVIGRKGTAGRAWLMEEPFWPSDTTFYLEWTRDVDLYFLFGYLTLRPLSGEHSRTTLPSLSRLDLESYLIPLPPLLEQRRIAHVLRTIRQAIEATDRVITAARELKRSLMHHLFTYGPVPVETTGRLPLRETGIGPVPAHWEVVRLGEVADARGGTAFPHRFQGQKEGRYPFYKVSDMNLPGNETYMRTANNRVGEQTIRALRAKPFPKDTIIFPKVGGAVYTNKKRLLTAEALVDNNVMGVSVRERGRCVPEYLFYWFESVDLRQFSNPGPLPSITARAIKNALIPLPPLSEQREIARILQAVDRKIAAEERRRAALQALFKTMLHLLMTGRIRVEEGQG